MRQVEIEIFVDTLGGSYYIESLTNEIDRISLALMKEINGKGWLQQGN